MSLTREEYENPNLIADLKARAEKAEREVLECYGLQGKLYAAEARAEKAERERDLAREGVGLIAERVRAETAEARAEKAERERDEALNRRCNCGMLRWECPSHAAIRARAEKLAAALREIAHGHYPCNAADGCGGSTIAARALADGEGK